MKILITPNSFKECADSVLTTQYISEHLKENLSTKFPNKKFEFISKPLSDGGDGFLSVCKEIYNLDLISYEISSPYEKEKLICECGYSAALKKIFVESANVLGLKLIPKEKRNPFHLSSIGMGELLKSIASDVDTGKLSVDNIIIGIGGTGTNDFGIGMCSALGLKLLDESKNVLGPGPDQFDKVKAIEWSKPEFSFSIDAVIDTDIPLLGESGASRIYAPQKGASPEDVVELEKGIENLVSLLPGDKTLYGAGGGLAAGLHYFLDAEYKFAMDFIREDLKVSKSVEPDIIITGEGQFDEQSLLNKATGILINEFKNTNAQIFIISGKVKNKSILNEYENVTLIELNKYFNSQQESIQNFEKGINLAIKEISQSVILNFGF